jgi:hypothetical protein
MLRKSLLAGVVFLAMVVTAVAQEEQVTLDRVVFITSPKWYVLKDLAVSKNVLYFRKYAIAVIDERLGPIEKTKNIASFACQRDSRLWDHWVVHLPRVGGPEDDRRTRLDLADGAQDPDRRRDVQHRR